MTGEDQGKMVPAAKAKRSWNPFSRLPPELRWKLSETFLRFWPIKLAQIICVIYIMVLTFSPAPRGLVTGDPGLIVDADPANTKAGLLLGYRAVIASSTAQMVCLGISRASAFSLYPVMVLVFLSKCRATINFLTSTQFGLYLVGDMHELHAYCGNYIAVDVWIHTLFHLIRWGLQGNIHLLWTHQTGITGLVVVLATPLIAIPMIFLVRRVRYEVRKALHYLFYLFAIGMCFHVPVSAVPNGGFIAYVMGICICWYTADALYVAMFMTEKIETTTFHVLPSGVQLTMDVSPRFQGQFVYGGHAYVCLPWVSRYEWHAFSLFEDPHNSARRQVFMLKAGDWTTAVHNALQRNSVRPVWIQGPFVSPYTNSASDYDNQILVASGIGITPALSIIREHKSSRRVNLIWMVRDAAMLEFFLDRFELDDDGWNLIFYTGKAPLSPALEELHLNVRIIKTRPDLNAIIPRIIHSIESGEGLPEVYTRKDDVKSKLAELAEHSEGKTSKQKLVEMRDFAGRQGFNLQAIMEESYPPSSPTKFGKVMDKPPVVPEDSEMGSAELLRSFSSVSRRPGRKVADDGNDTLSSSDRSQTTFTATFQLGAKPSKGAPPAGDGGASKAEEYVAGLDPDTIATWGMMYCGGSKPVEESLKEISRRYGLKLTCEAFAW